jgi:hypothetical protein
MQAIKDVETMEEEMRDAEAELKREKQEAEEALQRQSKRLKIATPGSATPAQTPSKTPSTRARFGL